MRVQRSSRPTAAAVQRTITGASASTCAVESSNNQAVANATSTQAGAPIKTSVRRTIHSLAAG